MISNKYILRLLFLVVMLVVGIVYSHATHNRAGEITYTRSPDNHLLYTFTVVTYTNSKSKVDKCHLVIKWGDGKSDSIPRVNGPEGNGCDHFGQDIGDDIKMNIYKGAHTYGNASVYTVSVSDPNRNEGIINIENSVNIDFYIETVLTIHPFLGYNASPVLLNPPIDKACIGVPFIHNPGAYDTDGDSLAYRLVHCLHDSGQAIPAYVYPNEVSGTGSIIIDAVNGDMIWDSPRIIGEYNVAIMIEEWRNGIKIGSIIRDMQIDVEDCPDTPPIIQNLRDTCVTAGETLRLTVKATDGDAAYHNITLTAKGGPLIMENGPAVFPQPVISNYSVNAVFFWKTQCSHITKYPYYVYFKAVDDGVPVKLVDIETLGISVKGPAPENPSAEAQGNSLLLKWNKTVCGNASGYNVYRRIDSVGYQPDNCITGVPFSTGYSLLKVLNGHSDTSFVDDNSGRGLIHGTRYCYMVTARYPYIMNDIEGYPSEEFCGSLKKDIPVLTNISVVKTDNDSGSMYLAWSKPIEIDTSLYNGPYSYKIYRARDVNGLVFDYIGDNMSINDTFFLDTMFNTQDYGYTYKIELNNNISTRTSPLASSVFLSIEATDNLLKLTWEDNVSWDNEAYTVYRKLHDSLSYDSIYLTPRKYYNDNGLQNEKSYYYHIKSIGEYSVSGILNPIINLSQIVEGVPTDNVPPCTPNLSVIPDCEDVENLLFWNNPNNSCADDVEKYRIYFEPIENAGIELLTTITDAKDTFFIHESLSSIAGCYVISAIDSASNESTLSSKICLDIDSCILYHLPNVFSPDGDTYNELFQPFQPYSFVESVDVTIFNRWGSIMYTTSEPDINWDGINQTSGQPCSEGVYFYICHVFENRLNGLTKRTITGFFHLKRRE